ncbi:hypothetical protein JNUCC0626_20890 [Lentzea sp. JNUCC 0626]|uniref:hypothetical protein n=1 Tax=Lentzea sp. JNUCC 0626 TaxID=3367513 RepID=UPI003749B5E6
MNPYLVPKGGDGPGPLCPHKDPTHELYYVEVDHTGVAFEQFKAEIGSVARVRESGRLVVALGWDGCGKSSLLNRCATWLKAFVQQESDGRCLVFPFVDACLDSDPVEDRQQAVYQCLFDELDNRGMISPQDRENLKERTLKLRYQYLSKFVLGDTVVVILLPRTEIEKEVENYAHWTHGNLVFLAESRQVDAVKTHWRKIRGANQGPAPIQLEVGKIDPDDGWAFVQALDLHRTDEDTYPFVSRDAIRKVIEAKEFSIGELHNLLFRLFEWIRIEGVNSGPLGSGQTGEVTYHHITDFYFRQGTT